MSVPVPVTLTSTIGSVTYTFTFVQPMVEKVTPTITNDPTETVQPSSGPMSNIANDYNGVQKSIVVTGKLLDQSSSVVTASSGTQPDIKTAEMMKIWLEGLMNGNQRAMGFQSNYEQYSLQSAAGTTTINGVAMPGTWVPTKVYIKSFSVDDDQPNIESIPFILTLWVAGL